MTSESSNKTRSHRFLKIRCGFFSIDYRSDRINDKISKNSTRKDKIVRKNSKCDTGKRLRFNVKGSNGINHANELCKKSNENCTSKMDMVKGFKIADAIIKIGSALSGLLPPIRHVMIWHARFD